MQTQTSRHFSGAINRVCRRINTQTTGMQTHTEYRQADISQAQLAERAVASTHRLQACRHRQNTGMHTQPKYSHAEIDRIQAARQRQNTCMHTHTEYRHQHTYRLQAPKHTQNTLASPETTINENFYQKQQVTCEIILRNPKENIKFLSNNETKITPRVKL